MGPAWPPGFRQRIGTGRLARAWLEKRAENSEGLGRVKGNVHIFRDSVQLDFIFWRAIALEPAAYRTPTCRAFTDRAVCQAHLSDSMLRHAPNSR